MPSQKSFLNLRFLQFAALGSCIIASYGFARPVTDSLFLHHHSSQNLPKVFLLSIFSTVICMGIYNHFNTRYPLLRILGFSSIISLIVMFICLGLYKLQVPGSVYLLYMWREMYVIVLIEIFWSLADSLFSLKTAQKSYGFLLATASIGGSLANLSVGIVSRAYGTEIALLGVVPCLSLCAFLTWRFSKNLGTKAVFLKKTQKTFGSQSLTVVRKSRYLLLLLFLIATVQISISLIDIRFNAALESAYPDLDAKTGIIGQIHMTIDMVAVTLQFISGYLIKFLGLGGIFVGIPLMLGVSIFSFILSPQFFMASVLKITSKCFDYSLFRATKEMLYIPLSPLEKTQGKALIDIFVYRVAKSSAALLMMALIALEIAQYSMHFVLALMLLWILLSALIMNRYKIVVRSHHEES